MSTDQSRARILLVDDDEDFLFQHRIQLEHAGFEVRTAATRAEAETAIETYTPDLAILDLMMDQHDDGFVLAHHLGRKVPGLPIVMVTAVTAETGLHFKPSTPAELAWTGVSVMLAKPIRFEQLKREIDRLLAARG